MKNEIAATLTYGTVGKKGTNGDGKTKATILPSEEKKSEYAYADPYQMDKWSLQAIARGQTTGELTYASVDDGYRQVQMIDSTYAEVSFDGKSCFVKSYRYVWDIVAHWLSR